MTKKISIFHFLIAVMLFSLVIPAGVTEATPTNQGKLTIHKFSQEPGTTPGTPGDGSELSTPPTGTAVPEVTYTIKQTHAFNEGTGDWTETPNAVAFTMKTGPDGTISKDLTLGRYTVKETAGPANINLNPEEFKVEIPMTNSDGTANNYRVHIYPKNEVIRGAVELTKKDGETGTALPGVKFDLYDKANNKVNESPLPLTDGNGKITVQDLSFGEYYFKEVSTISGYVLGGKTEIFKITESGSVIKVTAKNYEEPGVEKEVDKSAVNRGEEVIYTIKLDLPADIKDYQNFVVTDTLHANLEFVSEGTTPSGFTLTQNGQKLTWTGDPANLSPGPANITFKAKVRKDAPANIDIENVAIIDYANEYNHGGENNSDPVIHTPTAGTLKVIKQDGKTQTKLTGAVFELRNTADEIVAGPKTSDANGEIDFGELNYGDYKLIETKAPGDYRKLRNPIDITINTDKSIHEITVDNYKSGWELPKTGGMGTTLFTLIGLIFMGAAIYLYMRRRRNAA